MGEAVLPCLEKQPSKIKLSSVGQALQGARTAHQLELFRLKTARDRLGGVLLAKASQQVLLRLKPRVAPGPVS